MHIGVDFDNTIVCYDELFHRVALERGLIPPGLPVSKFSVRDHIRRTAGEDAWTELQGIVYGPRMSEAQPYPGVLQFFLDCRRAGIRLSIISHKTRQPVLGQPHDLHKAAQQWLELNRFFDPDFIGLSRSDVFFELTRAAKLERIAAQSCTHFIDDLPEVLTEPAFPKISRVLYDPNRLHAQATVYQRAQSWGEIWDFMRLGVAGELPPQVVELLAQPVFKQHGPIVPLSGGGNNRVFRVALEVGEAVLKVYFHEGLAHDRFRSERAIYHCLSLRGECWTPEPLSWDDTRRIGLFRFVPGRKLRADELTQAHADQVIAFLIALNRDRQAAQVPIASTPCFQTTDLLTHVSARLEGLQKIEISGEIDHHALDFVTGALLPTWDKISAGLKKSMPVASPLPQAQRVISPSDFGFHNAILAEDGRLRFFDFEYAGWDDPAQMIGDFFCQPQIPVPMEFCGSFTQTLTRELSLDPALPARVRAYLPALRIKWCCIILNEFRRGVKARRDFARGSATTEEMKSKQLEKARQYFQNAFLNY